MAYAMQQPFQHAGFLCRIRSHMLNKNIEEQLVTKAVTGFQAKWERRDHDTGHANLSLLPLPLQREVTPLTASSCLGSDSSFHLGPAFLRYGVQVRASTLGETLRLVPCFADCPAEVWRQLVGALKITNHLAGEGAYMSKGTGSYWHTNT